MSIPTDVPSGSVPADPEALVHSLFAAFAAGDLEAPMGTWRDDASFTALSPPGGPVTLTKEQYWTQFLPGAVAAMPGYQLEVEATEAFGPLVVVHLRSTWSEGAGEGVMIFRVVDGRVAEAWALHADGSDATGYF